MGSWVLQESGPREGCTTFCRVLRKIVKRDMALEAKVTVERYLRIAVLGENGEF